VESHPSPCLTIYMNICMYVCMYAWMNGWMDGWMDGWMCALLAPKMLGGFYACLLFKSSSITDRCPGSMGIPVPTI
jgi:hypothetical protein